MNKTLIFSLFFVFILSCKSDPYKTELIKIDSNYKEVCLEKPYQHRNVWGLYLSIVGENINETSIDFIRSDSNYIEKIILTNENNEYLYNSDYYGDNVTLKIYSKTNEGQIIIKYDFKTL